MVLYLLKMLVILVMCPILLIGGVQTLTIDSQLGTSIEDCFQRLSIGEQLPNAAIYRNVSELTTRECEQICKQDKQCQSYDYGVGAKGNATCNLSTLDEKEVKEKNPLTRNPDYDVYVRRFQCEQNPPSPIQPLLDEPPQDKPQHRPVFRPDMDELPDYLVSGDIEPFNNGKPSPYRPDDISQRPNLDVGPTYGDHKPQSMPYPDSYRPNRPSRPDRPQDSYKPGIQDPYRPNGYEKPQDQYMPSRPYKKPRPESNDVLHFDIYGNPMDEFHKGPYMPEKPNYNYIIRPNRRPRPEDEYIKPSKPMDYYPGHPSGPVGPPRPTYSYNSQYAGSYGQNSQNDNQVHVEIYDPPRPYIPIKDRPTHDNYGPGFLGYGTYSSQNPYMQNSGYTGSITEIGHDHMPYKPQKPYGQEPGYDKPSQPNKGSYGVQNDYNQNGNGGYGNTNKPSSHSYQRPNDRYKPLANQNYNSQNSYGSNDQSQFNYGGSYDSHRPTYQADSGYQKPQKPSYGGDKGDYGNQGSYGGSQGYYSSNKGQSSTQNSYDNGQSAYGIHGSYGQGSHPQDSYGFQGGYGTQSFGNHNSFGSQGGYGISQGTYGSSYGGIKGSYDSNQGTYGSNQGSYGSNQATYGSNQATYGSNQATYGSNQGSHGSHNSGYGSQISHHNNRPVFDYETQKPGYDNQKPVYNQKPGYGSQKPDNDSPRPGYGQKPAYHKPGYENERPDPYEPTGYGVPDSGYGKPSYGDEKPSYANNKPSYTSDKPSYTNDKPGYINDKPSYANDKPIYGNDKPGYGNERPSYGNERPSYDDDNGYGSEKPAYDSQRPAYDSQKPGYGSQRPAYDSQRPAYDSQKPGYGSQRPAYDSQRPAYDSQRPSYSTKPDSGYQESGYGNQELEDTGYGPNATHRPDIKPVYEFEMDRPSNVPVYIARPGGGVVTSRPVVIGDYQRPLYKEPGLSYAACFRRVLAGRRALRSFVRKVLPCDQLEDCRRECALETRFHCESFNYRLDLSFRGKGLCELMTKPIEAFDVQRDFVDDKNYDFYEVDRNSLEPNCPETLRGPGFLHSGFLSSKDRDNIPKDAPNRIDHRFDHRIDHRPNRVDQSGWRDRHDWAGGHRDRFPVEDRRHYGNRRPEEHYIPYQIGQVGLARIDEDQNQWGQYGGNYGGHYYKDSSDYQNSISHWGLTSARPVGVKPHDSRKSHGFDYHSLGKNLDFDLSGHDFQDIEDHSHASPSKGVRYGYGSWKRGRWNSSVTTGLDFEDPQGREEEGTALEDENECYSRRRPGMSLKSGAIRRSLVADSVVDCEAACFGEREFKCVSYSYRYSTSRGTDNCFLSERPYRGLEMSADTGSDVYAMPQDKRCSAVSTRPWVESECFWHVRSGAAVRGRDASAALTVGGLGACEAECIRAQGFFCRGFSFRFDSPAVGEEDIHNCILTSSPTTRLASAPSAAAGHELYARGNYGRGCEPAVYDDKQNGECYLQYDKAARLSGPAVRGQARVADEQTCGAACTEAPFRCLSFSFNNNAPPSSDNCLLSEVRLFDLQRGVDYVHSADDWLFAFDLFNSQCWRKVHGEEPSLELPHPILPPSGEDRESYPGAGPPALAGPPSGPEYLPDPPEISYIPDSGPPSGPNGPSGPDGPIYKPEPEYRPNYETGPYQEPYKPGSKPVRPDPDTYKPGFRPPSNPNFRPPEVIIPYKPEYPDPDLYRPAYRPPKPERPGFGPSEPKRPGFEVDPRPDYRPERPYPPRPEEKPFRPEGYPKPVQGLPGLRPGEYRPVKPVRPVLPEERPGIRPQKPVYHGDRENTIPMEASWRHYTVSGFPCRAGTACARNLVSGHWACEPEGGEIGSWDYCCTPTHRCGYSEGFHKPWCYVGQKADQWRPCSEKYYPYHQHSGPHPSQGHREQHKPHRPWRDLPPPGRSPWPVKAVTPPPPDYTPHWDKPPGPYLSEADRKYWDDLYENGPKAYYDRDGNPLPGYSRVPTETRPYIRYRNDRPSPGPSPGQWVPVSRDPPPVPGLGAPRYWPVAYLHRGPPPNMTYFRYNETRPATTERYDTTTTPKDRPEARSDDDDDGDGHIINDTGPNNKARSYNDSTDNDNYDSNDKSRENDNSSSDSKRNDNSRNDNKPKNSNDDEVTRNRDVKKVNDSKSDDTFETNVDKTTAKSPIEEKVKTSDVELVTPEDFKMDSIKGLDGKIDDFSKSIEVLDIEDAKGEKISDLKSLEAEERQIEAIGRLLASRRGSKLIIEKRSEKELENKNIAVDKDTIEFNFGNRFPTSERRGVIKRISKDEIERDRNPDRSLEVSETTFVRPPRVLSTTENVRKAFVNGKVFYDATIREQRDLFTNSTRKAKNLRRTENTTPSIINNSNYGRKKTVITRNANPVRRVKRVYRKRYNPGEVRRRLLERDRTKNNTESSRTE